MDRVAEDGKTGKKTSAITSPNAGSPKTESPKAESPKAESPKAESPKPWGQPLTIYIILTILTIYLPLEK